MLALFICMIKIKLKQNGLLGEASIRYLVDRFKLPQEFAEQVNSQYTQNSDTLLEIYISQYGRPDRRTDKPDVQDLTREFSFWMDRIGKRIDAVLKRTPKLKKEFLELSNEDYPLFVSYVNSKFFKNSLPDDFVREVKQNYRDNWEELIEVYSYYNFDRTPKNFQTSFDNFMRYNDGNDIDAAFKKEPNSKPRLMKMLFMNKNLFLDEIMRIAHSSAGQEEVVLDAGDGYKWYDLKTNYCSAEAARMGHCGQAGYGGTLYSLRKETSNAKEGEDKDASYVTIEMNEKTFQIHQIKGPQNTFPVRRFWPYIYKFFEHFEIEQNDIKEQLANENKNFMSYFINDYEKTYEDELDELEEMIIPLWRSNYSDPELEEFNKKFDSMANKYMFHADADLKPDEITDMFFLLEQGLGRKFSPKIITDKFFELYPREKSVEYNLKVIDLILDYIESGGGGSLDDYIKTILINLNIISKRDDKTMEAYKNYIAKNFGHITDIFAESKKKQKIKFKKDHRGYFRL